MTVIEIALILLPLLILCVGLLMDEPDGDSTRSE